MQAKNLRRRGMKAYRVYVGTADAQHVASLAGLFFEGATVFQTIGAWKATLESSTVVEVLTRDSRRVARFAKDLCRLYGQDCVLVSYARVASYFAGIGAGPASLSRTRRSDRRNGR